MSGPGPSASAREAGYLAELAARGLGASLVRAEQTTEAAGAAAADAMLAELASAPGAEAPTAVFAVNDPLAVGAIGALRGQGLEVPRDVSVVGYDDSPIASYRLVSLTSVSGDVRELGEAAGAALVAMLEGEGEFPPSRRLAPRLVVRRSTAAPRVHRRSPGAGPV
ncbi:LacI family transcriptional regulator [Leucobacter allii]|uniref:substrate-binding domain-containing protein n=1 Tax=Leucobacter allii TaxID=2932247 RepID=UPI001FD2CE47|nr:LacI family DNA-binding transcriptional regulator [Leucobacter allii]UOR03446.1 LacI family transcriptional regulator [Leucobacter allii]